MRSALKRSLRVGTMGALIVSGLLVTHAAIVPSVGAQATGNPFAKILDKLDEIVTILTNPQTQYSQSWDKVFPVGERFVVLTAFNNEAVLDRETGLVWQRSPSLATATWNNWRASCVSAATGGRKGWRLPAIAELMSLVDPNAGGAPFLPPGHPFANVISNAYFSATTYADDPIIAWGVNFSTGDKGSLNKSISFFYAWCVRGPMQESVY